MSASRISIAQVGHPLLDAKFVSYGKQLEEFFNNSRGPRHFKVFAKHGRPFSAQDDVGFSMVDIEACRRR